MVEEVASENLCKDVKDACGVCISIWSTIMVNLKRRLDYFGIQIFSIQKVGLLCEEYPRGDFSINYTLNGPRVLKLVHLVLRFVNSFVRLINYFMMNRECLILCEFLCVIKNRETLRVFV